jgi:magnesium transporter
MIHIYRWNESGARSVGDDLGLVVPERQDEWVWVDVVAEPAATIRSIGERFGLDATSVEESLSATSLPLVEEHLNEVYIVLHGFTTGTDGRLSTPEIDVFVGERFLITIRDGERATIEHVKERLVEEGGLPVTSPAGLLAFMALISGRRFAPLIQELERQVDNLEELSVQADPQTVIEVQALRRDVIYLRRALGPQYDAYEDLSESTHPAIDDEARQLLARVASQHRRSLESLEAGRALLGSLLETYRGAVADQTNEIMRVLTVFSAILLPLTLITGIWGMNFSRIPGADAPRGFWILIALMLSLASGVWIYFTRRGFIGAPRLRELPKAVGLGLYNLGTAPIRVVSDGIKQMGKPED